MKRFVKILLLPFLLIFLSCTSKDKNELNIYTWTSYIPEEIVKAFEKETGIKVNLSYYDTNDTMLAKVLAGASQYDIVSPSTDFIDVMVKNDLLEKLDKTKLGKTFDNLDTETLKLYENAKNYDDGLNYSIPYGFFATGVTVNTEIVKEIPEDVLTLFLDERYKSHMTMLDDGRETLGMILQYLGYESDSKDDKQLEEAKQLIIKMKKNLAKFDSTTSGKGLATNEFYISHGYPDVFYETDKEEQAKFKYILPKGAMMYIDNMSILKESKNKEEAYKFLEYLYRPENYVKVFEEFRQIPVVKGIYNLTDETPIASAEDIIKNSKLPFGLDEEAREKQEKIWNEIKLAK